MLELTNQFQTSHDDSFDRLVQISISLIRSVLKSHLPKQHDLYNILR